MLCWPMVTLLPTPLLLLLHLHLLLLHVHQPIMPDAAADSLGISPHKDAGFLTVLLQDSTPGLQVC